MLIQTTIQLINYAIKGFTKVHRPALPSVGLKITTSVDVLVKDHTKEQAPLITHLATITWTSFFSVLCYDQFIVIVFWLWSKGSEFKPCWGCKWSGVVTKWVQDWWVAWLNNTNMWWGEQRAVFCAILWLVSGYYPIYRSPLDITPVGHYFLWILPLYTLLLCSTTLYDITMGNDIIRDIHCDVTMSNDIAICTSQCMMMLLWTYITIPTYDINVSPVNSLQLYT